MYKCLIEKRILHKISNKNDYTLLQYELEVDVVPESSHLLKDGQWYSGPLTSVIWAIDDECVHCRVEDEFPFMQGYEDYSHDSIVNTYQQQGWSPNRDKIVQV